MFNRSNPLHIHNRPRSNSHPVRPLRSRTPSEINEGAPVRPPRNPARLRTPNQELLGPLTFVATNSTTASQHDCWEGEIGNGGNRPSLDAPLSKSLVKRHQKAREVPLPQINTLDRKILQELKQSMLARSAQFALKNNAKHHPFPSDEVPYPRSYDHKCLDTDVWETVFCEQYCGNITFHTFDVPPTKVLDLGCGSGSWIMACARRWKDCHFVGLDVVPLHPDLGRSELGQRVTWVQASFLESLPFPNEEFDFVHIKRIARGVPEHKWDALFEEIVRVMKPGAVLEMLEEDLYIPGLVMDPTDNEPQSPASLSPSSPEESIQPIIRPSTSLPDIAASYSSFQTIRRSISERRKPQPPVSQATSNTYPPPVPTLPPPPTPDYSRVFPRPKAPKAKARPTAGRFEFRNLLSKRSGRQDGAETDEEQSKKPKKESLISMSLFDLHRPPSASGRSQFSKPYLNTSGTSSNSTLRSNTTVRIPPVPLQGLHRFSETEPRLPPSPESESPCYELEVDFLRDNESQQSFSQLFSYPAPEEDVRWKPPANVLSSLNSGLFHEGEPMETEADQWEEKLNLFPPPLPPKDIPGRTTSLAISLSPSSSNLSSPTGLSLSVRSSRLTDHTEHNDDQWLSSASDKSGLRKCRSTNSLAVSTSSSTGPPPSQNTRLNDHSGVESSPIILTNAEMPPNPRQHKLLDVIYAEMHAARSVNLAPISLIENRIRTHFKNVSTRAPLIFAFPPPPGCQHRPEFDTVELRQRKLTQQRRAERDAPDFCQLSPLISAFPLPPGCENLPEFDGTPLSALPLTPSPKVPRPSNLKSTSPHPTRDRSFSFTNNGPGPSRPRSSSVKSGHSPIVSPESVNHRQPSPKDSRSSIRPSDGAVPDRVFVTGEGLATWKNDRLVMDAQTADGFSPARVTGEERERHRQRSDSLSARPNDVKGDGGGETRKKLPASALTLTRPSTAGSLPPPSAFVYKNPNASSSPPSAASFSSSSLVRRDSVKGKRSPTVAAGRAQLDALANKKSETNTRSLSLHLRVRVVEILGCSEAMWDWVREFQTRELEKERRLKEKMAMASKPTQGIGGGRVAYYHQDRTRNRGTRERADSMKQGLASKTSRETLTLASKTSREPKPLAAKTSREPPSPATKTSGDQPPPAAKPVRRVGGGRVSYFHQPAVRNPGGRERANSGSTDNSILRQRRAIRSHTADAKNQGAPSLYSVTSSGSGKTDDPHDRMDRIIKQELMHMTRQRFDEILLWFQFDMDDSIRLTRSMTTRAQCAPYPTEPSEQRKSFDEACQKLETHLKLHPKLPTPLLESSGCGLSSASTRNSQPGEGDLCCMPALLNLVHPSKRLCRTIRVWVAWKP